MGLACPELASSGCLISRAPHGKRIHPESAHPPAALNGHGAARRRLAKAGRAAQLELTRPLFYTLRYLRRVLGAMIPAATLVAAEAGRPNLALLVLMDALFLRALQPPTPACGDRFSGGRTRRHVHPRQLVPQSPVLLSGHLFHKAFISPEQDLVV